MEAEDDPQSALAGQLSGCALSQLRQDMGGLTSGEYQRLCAMVSALDKRDEEAADAMPSA